MPGSSDNSFAVEDGSKTLSVIAMASSYEAQRFPRFSILTCESGNYQGSLFPVTFFFSVLLSSSAADEVRAVKPVFDNLFDIDLEQVSSGRIYELGIVEIHSRTCMVDYCRESA